MGTSLIQIGQALSGAALPIAYGPVRVRGNELINQQLSDNSRVALHILGEGPWDGIDRLWINKKLVNINDVTLVHFHPGTDGTLGGGLVPSSNGGDQLVDNFWTSLPVNMQRLTYSRKAYLMVKVSPDPQSPDASLDVVGDYRALKLRIFDNAGNQTAFQFSKNYVWMILDLLCRTMLNREWLVSSAAAAGGDLTAAQKARIDFQSFSDSAAWCDFNIGGGIKRFEGGVAFPQTVGLKDALDQLCTLSQTYLVERSGKILLYSDQARASTFTLTSDHITAGTFSATKAQLRGASNRFIATFNDLNAQKSADIDTSANTGLSRTANVVTVKVPAGQQHPFQVGDNVDIVNPDDASFAGTITVASVIDNRNFTGAQTGANANSGGGYVGTTESRFAQRTKIVDHEQHQLAVGQRGLNLTPTYKRVPVSLDLGNNTIDRVERVLNFIKLRNLGADASPYIAPFTVDVEASLYAVDANSHTLIEQICGDILTVDKSVSEEFQGDYEIMKMQISLPGATQSADNAGQSATAATLTLSLKQYLPGAFSDSADTPQAIVPTISRLGLKVVETLDGFGNQVVSLAKTIDDPVTTLRNAVREIDGNRRSIIDFTQGHLSKNLGNIADDVSSGRFSRRASRIVNAGVAQWFKVGTWVFGNDALGHSLHLDVVGGVGYNTGTPNQGHAEIVVRSSNGGSGAPNISGATWTAMGTSPFGAVKIVATGGSISQANTSWEIWAQFNLFSDSLIQASVDTTDTWTPSGTTGADPGAAGATIVLATGQTVIDRSGITNPGAVDFARGYTNKHLGNVPDDGGSSRFAVLVIDGNRRAVVDFTQGHLNKNLDNVANGTRCAWDTGTQKSAAVDSSGNLLLKNVSQAVGSTSSPSTSSASYSTIPEMSVTATTQGNKVSIKFSGSFGNNFTNSPLIVQIALFRDGSQITTDYEFTVELSRIVLVALNFDDTPTAASHTYTVAWAVPSAASGIFAFQTARSLQMTELG
jgi:hypothetical protein